jgi:glucose-1-phosphatase
MQHVQNIIFDLGGVIINLDNKKTEEAFVALGAKDFGNYFGHGFAASFFSDYEIGKISDEEFIGSLRKLLSVASTDRLIKSAWNAMLLDFPAGRIQLLEQLARKYRIFLFSNTNALHLQEVNRIFGAQFSPLSLDQLFEKAYYSHILGLRKPDPHSYKRIVEENSLDPAKTLFVDDALPNVQGATGAGLLGFHLRPGMDIVSMDW